MRLATNLHTNSGVYFLVYEIEATIEVFYMLLR